MGVNISETFQLIKIIFKNQKFEIQNYKKHDLKNQAMEASKMSPDF